MKKVIRNDDVTILVDDNTWNRIVKNPKLFGSTFKLAEEEKPDVPIYGDKEYEADKRLAKELVATGRKEEARKVLVRLLEYKQTAYYSKLLKEVS